MNENKLSLCNFFKLISRTISSKRTMFLGEQELKLPWGIIIFPREKGALVVA
jgi:hypothetical protein